MLQNLKLGTRLALAFGVILLLMIAMAAVSVDRVNLIDSSLTTMNDVNSVKQRYAINFRGSVHDRAISLRDVVLVSDPMELQAAIDAIETLSRKYTESAGPLDAIMASNGDPGSQEDSILASIKEIERETLPIIARVVSLRRQGSASEAHALLMGAARPAFTEWLKRINQFIDLQEAKNKAIAAHTRAVAANFQFLTIAVTAGALALGIGAAVWSLLSIRPLRSLTDLMGRLAKGDHSFPIPYTARGDEVGAIARAVQVFKEGGIERMKLEEAASHFRDELDVKLKETEAAFRSSGQAQTEIMDALASKLLKLAEGDLSVRLEGSFASEYGRLQSDFNTALTQLEEAMSGIAAASSGLEGGAVELAQASDDLARRTEQQAAGIEQTAAALNEITTTVRRTAGGAQQASKVVTAAREDAEKSGKIVDDAVAAMGEIEQSSEKIGRIIGVIDEIAFQTNLLALNAGVEAARAGEAGRGFAVVAQEVRGLAQRSAEAAKEIKELISTSRGQVEQGVDLVGRTGLALRRIVDQVSSINDLVGEINHSAQEQAGSLAEVNTAIGQMDQVVQQNAAMVEQATAATHSMRSDAESLSALLGRFKMQARAAAASPSATRRPARSAPPARSPAPVVRMRGHATALASKPAVDGWEEF